MLHILLFLTAVALPPKPARYVTDNAGILGDARVSALNEKLAQFERDTSDQILVYVDRDLPPDTTIEQMGADAIHTWGVGQKGKDNGAILFIFTGARKMRIAVGYGLESTLTDAKARRILSTVVKPRLLQGDTAGAIDRGTDAILATVRGGEFQGTGATHARASNAHDVAFAVLIFIAIIVLPLVFIVIVLNRRRGGVTSASTTSPSPSGRWSSWSDSSSSSLSSSSSDSSSSSSDFSGG